MPSIPDRSSFSDLPGCLLCAKTSPAQAHAESDEPEEDDEDIRKTREKGGKRTMLCRMERLPIRYVLHAVWERLGVNNRSKSKQGSSFRVVGLSADWLFS